MSSKNIYQRVNSVMNGLEIINKDTKVANQYYAVSHDFVISKLRSKLCDAGIVIRASQSYLENPFYETEIKDKYGSKELRLYRAHYDVSFVNIDDPKDQITISIESHSVLSNDKSPGVTYSYAVKMAILKLFSIETGENDEKTVENIVYNKKTPSVPNVEKTTNTLTGDRKKLWDMILDKNGGDIEKSKLELEKLTEFKKNDGTTYKCSDINKLSDKQVYIILKKLTSKNEHINDLVSTNDLLNV